VKQEQQRVAVGLGNGHFISVRQVSSGTATMQRGPRDDAFTPPPAPAAAAGPVIHQSPHTAAVCRQIGNL